MKREGLTRMISISISTDDMYVAMSAEFKHKVSYKDRFLGGSDDDGAARASKAANNSMQSLNSKEGRVELFIFNIAVVDAVRTILRDPFKPIVAHGVHWSNILSFDICPARHLMLTLGYDQQVKLWDYG